MTILFTKTGYLLIIVELDLNSLNYRLEWLEVGQNLVLRVYRKVGLKALGAGFSNT